MKVWTRIGLIAAVMSTSVFATATTASAADYEKNVYNNAGVIKAKFKFDNASNVLCARLFTTNESGAYARATLTVTNGGGTYMTVDATANGEPNCYALPSTYNGRPATMYGTFVNNNGSIKYTDVARFTY